jgi:organic radical activating enzyme
MSLQKDIFLIYKNKKNFKSLNIESPMVSVTGGEPLIHILETLL